MSVAASTALTAVGATDTLLPLFLCLTNIPGGKTDNGSDHSEDHKINQLHKCSLSVRSVGLAELAVCTEAQPGQNCGKGQHKQ